VELVPDVSLIAGLIAGPARAAILAALVDGRALPAGELAFIGNVAPQTASFHLRKLMEASLIAVEKQGKHSYYRLANERVAATLESIAALAPARASDARPQSRHESERMRELRFARSCYRHLAGKLAVEITRVLVDRSLVTADSDAFSLTARGRTWFEELGVSLQKPSSKACLDWTERRPHLVGPLGAALLTRLTDLRWIARIPDTRAVRVTHAGAMAIERQFGITIPRL
jgi:DNA-binding transcriptional ArsR family regulator